MYCHKCQTEIDSESKTCPQCGEIQHRVEVLSPEERENFQGVTIEANSDERQHRDYYEYENEEYSEPRKGVYVRRFNFGSGKGNLLNRILVGLIVLGVLFLAFPLLFAFLGILIIGSFLSLVLRRR